MTQTKYHDIITKYPDVVEGGAPFPDYLYVCGGDHDAGEEAHWTPFQGAAVEYIRNLPTPWDVQTEKLIAFFFGVVSHYIADLNWHGLGSIPNAYGFIETSGMQDFNCTGNLCDVAHTAADTGGEFLAAWQTNVKSLNPLAWYIPNDDIIKIYKSVNFTVNSTALSECQAIFVAGVEVVKYVSWAAYLEETDHAPWEVENYIDFPLGGIDDMAMFSNRFWNRFANWVENGAPDPLPSDHHPDPNGIGAEEAPVTVSTTRRIVNGKTSFSKRHKDLIRTLAPLLAGTDFISVEHDASQAGRATSTMRRMWSDTQVRTHIDELLARYPPAQRNGEGGEVGAVRDNGEANGTNTTAVERAVHTLRQLLGPTRKRHPDLPVCAASTSLKNSASTPPSVAATPVTEFQSNQAVEYLGFALAAGDFDGDNVTDLAMAAYGHTPTPQYAQSGAVYVSFGKEGARNGTGPNGSVPITNVNAASYYSRLGWKILALDFNKDGVDDLVAAAPTSGVGATWQTTVAASPTYVFSGEVHVFFGMKGQQSFSPTADYVIKATGRYTFFGQTLEKGDLDGDGFDDILVGAYLANENNGYIRGYLSSASRIKGGVVDADAAADLAIAGTAADAFSQFGFSMVVAALHMKNPHVNGTLLIVSAPGFRLTPAGPAVGRVYAFQVGSQLALQKLRGGSAEAYFSLTGTVMNGKFGYDVTIGFPLADSTVCVLAISAPSVTTGTLDGLAGEVYMLPLAKVPAGSHSITVAPVVTTLQGSYYGGKFGGSVLLADLDKDGCDDVLIGSAEANDVFSTTGHFRGIVHGWKGGKSFPTGTVSDSSSATWNTMGANEHEKLGYALVAGQFGWGGGGDASTMQLAISAPRAPGILGVEMAGSVRIYNPPF